MATVVVDPVLQPITLANAPVREKAEDFGGVAQRDAEDDPKVTADKSKNASTLPIVNLEDKENAGTQEEQTSLSVSDDSTVPKVTPTIDDMVLAIEKPTELGMDGKASSIPVTVALTSDMASSSVPVVERSEDTQVKNDNELAGATDSPIEISPFSAPVTPQDTKVDGIPTPTFEHQVKFVAPEQPDSPSRPSDVKTDVVAVDEVAPDALEGISSADKTTMPDKVPVAAKGVPFVANATVVERLQAAKHEAIFGEESVGEEERPEVTSPMAQNEPELKNILILDSVQPPTVAATSDVKKDAVIEDAIVIEKAPLIEEKEKVATAEGAPVVEATPASITSEASEALSASVSEAQIPEVVSSIEQLVGAGVVGQPTVVADEILEAEGSTVDSAKIGEEGRGKEDLQLSTTIAAKTTPIEDETPTVSVIYTATVEEGEAPIVEAGKEKLEKTTAVEAVPIVEVKELDKGGMLPSVAIRGEPSPLVEEAPIVEVATGKEAGPVEAVIEGIPASAVTVPLVEGPTSVEDAYIESAGTSEQATEEPSTTTVLMASVVLVENSLRERIVFEKSPAVEEKFIVSSTPNVKDAPVIAERLGPAVQTSVIEEPLAVPVVGGVPVAKVLTGADKVEEESSGSTPVAEPASTAEAGLTFATNGPVEVVEPLEEAPAAHAPFIPQPSSAEVPLDDIHEPVNAMVTGEKSANEAAVIPTGDTLVIEEVAGEQVVAGAHNAESIVETMLTIVNETPADHALVAVPVPTEASVGETELPVEKELPVENTFVVEEITATEEISVVEQGGVSNVFKNPPAVEGIPEAASVIKPSPAVEEVTVVDETSGVQVDGIPVVESALNEDIAQKLEEHIIEPHTSESRGLVVGGVATFVVEPAGVAEKVVPVVSPPIEPSSLDSIPIVDAASLVDKASAVPTAADDLPAEQEGKLGGNPVEPVVFEEVDVIEIESILKVEPDVDQSSIEAPVDVETEKGHAKYAPIEGIAVAEAAAEAKSVVEVVADPRDDEPIGDGVSREERIAAHEPSVVASTVERRIEVHAAPSSGTETAVVEAPGIERNAVEEKEANTRPYDYAPSGSETSSTEKIVASLVEERPEEGETLAPVDPSVIEDNNITNESPAVDSSIQVNDSTPVAVIQAPVVIDKVDLHSTETALASTTSLDEIAVNPVSDLPLTEGEPNVDAAEIVSDQDQQPVSAESDIGTLLTPVGAEIERPKSPWTPSYSVTTQGPGIHAEEDIPAIEELPLPPSQVPVVALTLVDSPAPLEEVQTQGSSEILEDHPKSPWTPSYSVSVQGSPLHDTVTLDETEPVSDTVVSTDQDIPVADEPTSSQTSISAKVETATEPVKDGSQEEPIVQSQSTLVIEEQPEATDEVTSTPAPEPVIEKTIDDVKLPVEEDSTSFKKLLTPDIGIERPVSPRTPSYSATQEEMVSVVPEVESTLATSLVPEDVVYKESSQAEELYAPEALMHEVVDEPEVTIISEPVVIAENVAAESTSTEAVEVGGHNSHAAERPVQLAASLIIEPQSERTDGIAPKPDVKSRTEEAFVSPEKIPADSIKTEHSDSASTPSSSAPLAHEDAVAEQTPEVEESSIPNTSIPEVQSTRIDVVPQTYNTAEADIATESLPTVAEPSKDNEDSSFVKTENAQQESASIIEEVIPTSEPISIPELEADVKLHVQVSSSEELLAPATEIERPSSPWTPSHSVTQQGHVTPTSEAESILPTSEALAPAADEHIVPAEPTPKDPSMNVEPSNEPPQVLAVVPDVSGGGETTEEDIEDAQPSTATDVELSHESDTTLLSPNIGIERPSSPWTPSYSVTQQGRTSPVPESELDVESAEKEVPAKNGLDENATSLTPEHQHQVEPVEPVAVAYAPVPVVKEEQIDDEPKSRDEDEITSPVLEHEHEVVATQQVQAVASLSVPIAEEAQVVAGPELHAVISSAPELDVEPVVKEEPAEDVLDVHTAPPVPEPRTDLEPVVKDDTVSIEKHEEITLSSSDPARDMEPGVNDKQVEQGHKEAVVSAAPELEPEVESSVKNEIVVSESLVTVEEEESRGGEHVASHTQVHEIRPSAKDEPGAYGDDEEAISLIPASIEKGKQTESRHEEQVPSPEVEPVVDNELVQEEVTLSAPEPVHDSKPALEDVPAKAETELHIEKVASPVLEPELRNVAPEAMQETESAVKEETVEDGRENQVVLPPPESFKEEHDKSLVNGQPIGNEHGQQTAVLVPASEQHIESVVEEKQVQDEPIKEEQDNERIPALSAHAVEDKQPEDQLAVPALELERKINSAAVNEPVTAPEPEQHVEQVAAPAPDLHHEIKTVEKVEEPVADVLDEQAASPVPEPESAVVEDKPPAPVEIKSMVVDKPASLQDADIESKANDEQVEVFVTKEEPGPQKDATLPSKAEPELVAEAEEVQIEVVPEILSAAEEPEVVDDHQVVEEHKEQAGSTVELLAKDEPKHDEQAAVPLPEAEQRTELVIEDKQAEDESEAPELVSELKEETGKDGHDDEAAPLSSQDELPEEEDDEQVAPSAPELDSPIKDESFEVEQAAAQPAPALKEEQDDVEPVPELQQEVRSQEKKVEEPAGDVEEQPTVFVPAMVKDEPAISPTPELVTETKPLVVEVEPDVKPKTEDVQLEIMSVAKGSAILPAPEPAVVKDEPVILPAVTETKPLVVDEPSVELDVESKSKDVPVEIESTAKDEEQPAVPPAAAVKDEPVISPTPEPESAAKDEQQVDERVMVAKVNEQAAPPVSVIKDEPKPQQEQVEIELAEKEERSVANEDQTPSSSVEQVHVEETPSNKQEPERAAKDEDVVEENTIDSRELSVDTSSFTDSTKSPWTPSHSMTTQDVGSPDVEMKKELPGQVFPVTEEDSKSVGSLDTVNESADVPDTLEVPFPRKRLESSASARLLRGALHKVPEGRASLDLAQGEFSKPSSPVVETSAVGIVESLTTTTTTTTTAEQETFSGSASDESDESSDDSSEVEHKGRWCVVM
ncbi:hypothetical protein DFS33DRAFT_1322376 [Desarmillaria ectypa]|nr:hypothetical protein DFS33DRAFT_1322376 [Desarmillaria ectypa]